MRGVQSTTLGTLPLPSPNGNRNMTNRTTRKVRIEAYVSAAERRQLTALASQLHISLSELIRRSVLGHGYRTRPAMKPCARWCGSMPTWRGLETC